MRNESLYNNLYRCIINQYFHMPDDTNNRELSDEELEMVVGGQSHEAFEHWRCEIINTLNYEALREDERRYND